MANFNEWNVTLNVTTDGNLYAECTTYLDTDGNLHYSHNEIGFSFNVDNNEIHVLNGWHIGTEDFDWSEDEDGLEIINYYHKGLIEQIEKELAL